MIAITILAVGKLKEQYLRKASEEYQKRLGGMCRITVTEIDEYKLPDNPSEAIIQKGLHAEGKELLKKIPQGSFVVPLCIEGKMIDSKGLAEKLQEVALAGKSQIVFIIGGSFGLSKEVKQRGDFKLSMSPMTFPHQLARIMLLEQVYRALSIQNHTKYHK